ncbi:MAG: adenylyltransferase/cytidyltransferase family protein [Candidatus Latescibacterota bacterium]|nr:adenylyltransferase/cytidyltransferase family protein [Candidatus Latescibacterota bacterium]
MCKPKGVGGVLVAKIVSRSELLVIRKDLRMLGQRVVFTNGCFDLIHRGHVEMLMEARSFGDVLVVGLNSDKGVRALKGLARPLFREEDRAVLLSAFECVSYVCIFDEISVESFVCALLPDVLVKGGDYSESDVVGKDAVIANGGRVQILSLWPDTSTTQLIDKIERGRS